MDRNANTPPKEHKPNTSLSARRAWIEIDSAVDSASGTLSLSARRAWIEMPKIGLMLVVSLSLSARRAWIEMLAPRLADMSAAVALRKESVDRNLGAWKSNHVCGKGRSPQGERG